MRTKLTHVDRNDIEQLLGEIDRYLAVVDVFRLEGLEPAYADDEWMWRLYGNVLTA